MKMIKLLLLLTFCITLHINIFSQNSEVESYFPPLGIIESNSPAPGYYFIASKSIMDVNQWYYIAIIDNYGTPVFFRKMSGLTTALRLLPDERLSYTFGKPRKIFFLDHMLKPDGFVTTETYRIDPHDYKISSDSGYVLLGVSNRTVDMSGIVVGGDPAAKVRDLIIQEFDKNKTLLYTWNSKDYFNILDAYEESSFVDFTSNDIDYAHVNGVDIDSDTSIIISSRHLEEITKIDRRTGDIIWRLGGKNNQFTFVNDEIRFSHQHIPRSLGNGKILLFDNGVLHDDIISTGVEYQINEVDMTATLTKRFNRSNENYTQTGGFIQRISNDNTMISWGSGWPSITEFHPDGSIAADIDFSEHSHSTQTSKYLWQTKVFETNVDSINFGLWDNSNIEQTVTITNNSDEQISINNIESRTDFFNVTTTLPLNIDPGLSQDLTIEFDATDLNTGYISDYMTLCWDIDTQRVARQVFLEGIKTDSESPVSQIYPQSTNIEIDTIITIDFSEPIYGENQFELNYSNIADFFILKKDDSDGEDVLFNAKINTEKKLVTLTPDNLLEPDQTYYISFTDNLYDYAENNVTGNEVSFHTVIETGIKNQMLSKNQFEVHPNPSNGIFTVNNITESGLYLEILTIYGKIVHKEQLNSDIKVLDLSKLGNGIFFMRATDNKGNISTKKVIVKQ